MVLCTILGHILRRTARTLGVGFLDRLAGALASRGIGFLHDRIRPGESEWDQRVHEALALHHQVLLVWSEKTVSESVWRPFAEDPSTRFRLVLARKRKGALPDALRDVPCVDLSRWRGSSKSAEVDRLASLFVADCRSGGGGWPHLSFWLRRRLAAIAWALAILVPCLSFGFNVLGAQDNICGIGPLSAGCGDLGLGKQPSREERLAWARLNRSDPSALQAFVVRFPDGVHRSAAADLLSACRPVAVMAWVPHKSTVGIFVSRLAATAVREREARMRARALAAEEGTKACTAHGFNDGFRYAGHLELRLDSVACAPVGDGVGCAAEGWAICHMTRAGSGKRLVCSGRESGGR